MKIRWIETKKTQLIAAQLSRLEKYPNPSITYWARKMKEEELVFDKLKRFFEQEPSLKEQAEKLKNTIDKKIWYQLKDRYLYV